jgi:hypothetical protein
VSFLVPPGATSVSVDVFWADDTGAAVTGKVAADFPAAKWSGGANTADTTITLSDLAAITTAHPNDNTAGGVKEREGGWYRLDLPNNMLTSAGRKTLTFAESAGKRILAPQIDVQSPKVDVDTIKTNPVVNGGTVTFPTGATLASTTNITAGTITTATNVTTVNGLAAGVVTAASIAADAITAAKIADGAIDTATFAAGTTIPRVTLADTLTTYTGNTPQTGDSFARIGNNGAGLTSLAPSATALSTAQWTNARAANLDNLDIAVSTRLATSGYTAPDNADVVTILSRVDVATSTRAAPGAAMTLSNGAITDATITLPTEATGTPSTFLQLVMWLAGMFGWRKVVKDSTGGTIKEYMADGSTVKTTSTYTSTGTVDTINKAS